ncbi:uncharacterized protein LOC110248715 [Exaiptasia diaphana]|uniref:Uncharacterized protein n=1 Tax=Exaiptasia diaphana TaxID=2652724 RepID=A0A913YS39_EXADI|nr:uncharacterized protein LOC110248715 [Exaiptasia diaphana]
MSFFLVLFASFVVFAAVEGLQHGTLRIGQTNPDNYYCETVTFPTNFTGVDPVKVFTSAGFGTNSSRVHDVVFTWVESVTTSSFKVCLVENGVGSDGDVTINWMAYQSIQSGVTDGSVRLNDWTTGTECKQVIFSHNFPSVPHIFMSAHHNVLDKKQDAATVWVEGITRNDFTVCMREARTFDGRHKDIDVTWMAMTEVPQTWNYHDFIRLDFPNTLVPSEADNDAFCQVVSFHEPYYAAPTIVVAPSHEYDSSDINAIHPEHNSISAWVEVSWKLLEQTSCVKDLVGLDNKHHPIEVDYIVFGDLDPCINKTCEYFGVCQAMSASVHQCVCVTQCPSYQDLVCASNGRTFDNMCALEREICQTQGNHSYYHPGGCQGFPFDKGTHHLNHVSVESHCEVVSLQPYAFYPDKPIHVQLTVNYINASLPANVHDATVTWSEKVNPDNFTVCMTKTGRNDQPTNDVASVDWIAYQGSPNGGVTGKERITQWWTGTKCTTLSLPSGKFTGTPTVLVTLEHQRDGLKHDAASVWVEGISSSSFQVCIRELQNFDGIHEEIDLDWMAFETLHLPIFYEHGSVHFANTETPLKSNNYAFCEVVNLAKSYTRRPSVLITATHDTSVGLTNPTCNGISAWIENITLVTFRVCLKELYSDRYDPVTLQYVVVSDMCGKGWNYFNGFCYRTFSTCASWNESESNCLDVNSNLTSVTSQEENTYIQLRHGGDTGWIGLQDIDSEGNFTWIDGTNVDFTYWAPNQPNGFPGDQDCVHTLGLRHDYHWNDVTCGSCHAYTCKRDIDECSVDYHMCDRNAQCTNSDGSYTCVCNSGYNGDGTSCSDIDECSSGVHSCDSNAQCTNTVGSYTCSCRLGFNGDGRTCSDVDECSSGAHSCNVNAQCTNTVGSFTCQCNSGYHGDGHSCTTDSIRLVGSFNSYEGRLEVYHSGQWGTVCDDGWGQSQASVACRQLGFSGVQSYITNTFGEGIDTIWLDDVTCNGNEVRMQDCSRRYGLWGSHNCVHSEDVGIICIP